MCGAGKWSAAVGSESGSLSTSSCALMVVASFQMADLSGNAGGFHPESTTLQPCLNQVSLDPETSDLEGEVCVLGIVPPVPLHLCEVCPIIEFGEGSTKGVELGVVADEI